MGVGSIWMEVLGLNLIEQDYAERRDYDERELDVFPTYLILK